MLFFPKTISFKKRFLFVLCFSLFFSYCNKIEQNNYISYQSYFPLKPGKFLIYELDSTVTRSFGTSFETHRYIIKDSVIDIIYDNLNRPSLRIFRYVKDANNEWHSANNTFMVTATGTRLEYVENNLRYIKMANPISAYTNWPGNTYLNISPFPFDDSFFRWQYSYADIGTAKTFNGITYSNTSTVVEYDSTLNRPFNPYGYSSFRKGYEVYADSVGMVYKDFMDWEYQVLSIISGCKNIHPNNNKGYDTVAINCQDNAHYCDSIAALPNNKIIDCDTTIENYSYNGYGVKQILLSHN
jgi:hypothetical protein